MGDVVDGWRVGVVRMMANAEGQVAKGKAFVVADKAKDHAELAVRRRQVDLDAGRELDALAAFGFTTAKGLDLDAFALELVASLAEHLGSGAAASHRVLGEGTLVEEDAGMAPPDWQGLPLAVCGQERPVLGL
jgi:hypothetical protein